jgi:hypothetical protein
MRHGRVGLRSCDEPHDKLPHRRESAAVEVASDAREPTRPHSRLPPRGTSVVWRRRLARLMQSPLTDSNRRPPPYRGGGRRRHRRTSLVDWVCVWLAASVLAAVDLLLTQTAADEVEVGVGRIPPRFLSARCRGDLGILRVLAVFASSRVSRPQSHVTARAFSDPVGRAGIEPATLGLKVDAAALARSRESSQEASVMRNRVRTGSGGLTKHC